MTIACHATTKVSLLREKHCDAFQFLNPLRKALDNHLGSAWSSPVRVPFSSRPIRHIGPRQFSKRLPLDNPIVVPSLLYTIRQTAQKVTHTHTIRRNVTKYAKLSYRQIKLNRIIVTASQYVSICKFYHFGIVTFSVTNNRTNDDYGKWQWQWQNGNGYGDDKDDGW